MPGLAELVLELKRNTAAQMALANSVAMLAQAVADVVDDDGSDDAEHERVHYLDGTPIK